MDQDERPSSPRWLQATKAFFIIAVPIMVLLPYQMWRQQAPEFEQIFPAALLTMSLAHLIFRSPYNKIRAWEVPLLIASICSAGAGAFLFTPDGEERLIGFQAFLAIFAALAMGYGFFCSAVGPNSRLRQEVIRPTKTVSRVGVIGFDIGLVAAPFAFVFYLLRYGLRKDPDTPG